MKKKSYDYDVIIVGAGPAGSTTARYIMQENSDLRILLIDQRKQVGVPIQCGEALSKISAWKKIMPANYPLEELFKIPNNAIANHIKHLEIFSPKLTKYTVDIDGMILYRDRFDQYLAKLATGNGVELQLDTTVKGLKDSHILLTSKGKITGDIIVGADGPHSLIAKSVGLKTPNDIFRLCPSVMCIVKGDFHDDSSRMYYGKRFGEGFAWLFPKGDTANIGLGSEWKKHGKSLNSILDNLLKNLDIPENNVIYRGGGPIPMGGIIPKTVKDNILIVGDAAGMVFSSTGLGIGPAMLAGRECGLSIKNYFENGTSLNSYEQRWRALLEKYFRNSLREKNMFKWLTRHDRVLELLLRIIGKYSFKVGGTYP